jgi:hypothetical protein
MLTDLLTFLASLRLRVANRSDLLLEIAALRHQLEVLQRRGGRVLREILIRGVRPYTAPLTPRIQDTPRHPKTLISARNSVMKPPEIQAAKR